MKSVKHLKTYLIKILPNSIESQPMQFRLGSKTKRSISKFWKTIFPAKNENEEKVTLKNLTMLCFDGSCQNGVETFEQIVT